MRLESAGLIPSSPAPYAPRPGEQEFDEAALLGGEQAAFNEAALLGGVDPRSDLFSLGSVLYTLCAGHTPFRASTAIAVLKRVCEETPRPIREVNADVPEWLCGLIAKLHAKSPVDRFQTAAEVADLLSRHLITVQQPAMTPTQPPPPRAEARAPRSGMSVGRRAAYTARRLAASTALIALGGAALSWVFWRRDEANAPDGGNGVALEVQPWTPRPAHQDRRAIGRP